tara:strand:- start:704 stop:826 length:123 start_codon:yes stop_codon:yes gene_type:complete
MDNRTNISRLNDKINKKQFFIDIFKTNKMDDVFLAAFKYE